MWPFKIDKPGREVPAESATGKERTLLVSQHQMHQPLNFPEKSFRLGTGRLVILSSILFYTGCVVPVPHKRLHASGVKARVVDSVSRKPVATAKVETMGEPREVALADADGAFVLKPVYGWHGAYFFGVISQSLFPGFDMPDRSREISITAPGYARLQIRVDQPIENDFIQAGNISIRRK